ncbi:antibiotic biosynthesis monooxygenase family protein [Agrococcus carbonis]|uniref:Heme-degrading monooxygenase HmoA n=1 Tax=Agrococcus carbonis TaxID=684552 RepID=A0A1H1PTU5_9MICO|nr:antibiotic biosynthesis monooxygenase [Agrococcus carbonis]SDS14565.1 Heme-degrading monooxygenase HmoA [Agrococcus carbonis]
MVLEVADLRAADGGGEAFESTIRHGLDAVLSTSRGFVGYQLRRSVESPDRYLLMIEWASVEDHTVGFRESAAYEQWSAIVRPVFRGAPNVEHFALRASSTSER